jgi:hypothetical protein
MQVGGSVMRRNRGELCPDGGLERTFRRRSRAGCVHGQVFYAIWLGHCP